MKLAPVVPPGAEFNLPTDLGAHFCYSHIAAQDPHYADFYRKKPGVVMDCPIYEGTPHDMTPAKLMIVAKLVEPTFLIIPDVRHNLNATLKQAEEYFDMLEGLDACTGVLQGSDQEELRHCARAYTWMGLKRIAIPKDVVKAIKVPRTSLVDHLLVAGVLDYNVSIHLLGGDWPYSAESTAQDIPQIKSMDTAEPWNAAICNQSLYVARPPVRSPEWLTKIHLPDPELFHINVAWLRDVLHDSSR